MDWRLESIDGVRGAGSPQSAQQQLGDEPCATSHAFKNRPAQGLHYIKTHPVVTD